MKPTGFYKLTADYLNLIKKLGGVYRDNKERPVYCCLQDRDNPDIYWAIPTSDISHRSPEQLERIKRMCALPNRDIRSCFYHIGHTNRPAIYKISNVLPVTADCIDGEYISQGAHLVLRDSKLIAEITRKLSRILFDENRHPDKYEQHITTIYEFLSCGNPDINPSVFAHIQKNILPQYDSFDKAHNRSHANRVIENSLRIAKGHNVDVTNVYIAAAYHDVGISLGRKDHEKHSADYLLADLKLKEWFTSEDLTELAEAVQDHRASNDNEPRSIYGKIVAEADRDIEYTTILTRVIQYSLEHYPDYTPEQHFDRAYTHMQEKYGDGGYLKLWLDSEPNRSNLNEIRNAMANLDDFKVDFMRFFSEYK